MYLVPVLRIYAGLNKLCSGYDIICFVNLLNSLKALDLVTMKKLDNKVNIIPVIAKSDTITKAELSKFKQKASVYVTSVTSS